MSLAHTRVRGSTLHNPCREAAQLGFILTAQMLLDHVKDTALMTANAGDTNISAVTFRTPEHSRPACALDLKRRLKAALANGHRRTFRQARQQCIPFGFNNKGFQVHDGPNEPSWTVTEETEAGVARDTQHPSHNAGYVVMVNNAVISIAQPFRADSAHALLKREQLRTFISRHRILHS